MEIIAVILSPLIWLMDLLFVTLFNWLGSAGLSILGISFICSLLLCPIQIRANSFEQKIALLINDVQHDVAKIDSSFKGEDYFEALEAIYRRYNYHPIKNILVAAGFLVSMPFLFSAILLFTDSKALVNQSFLYISDLSKTDALLSFRSIDINLTPILMFILSLLDAFIRYKNKPQMLKKFLIISLILLFLVYQLPSGLILYWIGSNIMSFLIYYFYKKHRLDNDST